MQQIQKMIEGQLLEDIRIKNELIFSDLRTGTLRRCSSDLLLVMPKYLFPPQVPITTLPLARRPLACPSTITEWT